ncbi:MAG: ribonuclease III [Verrucomicrobia bacterium]|nr:ribonuclease III [Verrucomicrobiota bacterium]MBU6446774.1 ribonuclease III [Verrucomicrobiota bacterium]MDE3047705.1 ribonuclease III [Verrucomicrobiota bacterium]
MNALERLQSELRPIEEKLGYAFENKSHLIQSLIHRSFINEYREGPLQHNERLEFLGDSVLGLIVADFLYHRLPAYPEGQLSQLRSKLVDAPACAQYLQKLGLTASILLGKGEAMSASKAKTSIFADVFEALLGAIYLDGGLGTAKSFMMFHFETEFEATIGSPPRNYKAELQDLSQREFQKIPTYKVVEESGPDHAKVFHVMVFLNDAEAGMGTGSSKKEAEQRAAFDALAKRGGIHK